jgi:hypothetical protein
MCLVWERYKDMQAKSEFWRLFEKCRRRLEGDILKDFKEFVCGLDFLPM